MYDTNVDEVEKLSRGHGLAVIRVTSAGDRLGRQGVTWQTVFLQAPDDGLGALPLLRHIIVNDSKSSTYKLALLRVLVRIADSATGLVEDVDDDTVSDARNTISQMPAHYITYPSKQEQVFVALSARAPRTSDFALDGPFLGSFGRLFVPRHLWQAMSRYAAWIEPALLSEWTELMQGYEGDARRTRDEHFALLRWLDPEHDTRLVRDFATNVRERNQNLYCLWRGCRLRDQFAIDPCLPFAAWPCNDLWSLFPSHPSVNKKKGDRLPSAESLVDARDRILEWWQTAYGPHDSMWERFVDEALTALPGSAVSSGSPQPEDVFDGLMLQRVTLKRDQQLAEWVCC